MWENLVGETPWQQIAGDACCFLFIIVFIAAVRQVVKVVADRNKPLQ